MTKTKLLAELNSRGITMVPSFEYAKEFIKYLAGKKQYDGHTMGRHEPARFDSTATSYDLADIIRAPHYFEYALSFTPIAEEFLGGEPVLYSMNTFTTYPNTEPDKYAHKMHIDYDDDKLLVLSTFMTDVDIDDGMHIFHCYDEITSHITGPAGTSFLEDTSQLHGGLQPTRNNRILAWTRWCLRTEPRTYGPDGLYPVDSMLLGDKYPADKKMQRIIRLVVK